MSKAFVDCTFRSIVVWTMHYTTAHLPINVLTLPDCMDCWYWWHVLHHIIKSTLISFPWSDSFRWTISLLLPFQSCITKHHSPQSAATCLACRCFFIFEVELFAADRHLSHWLNLYCVLCHCDVVVVLFMWVLPWRNDFSLSFLLAGLHVHWHVQDRIPSTTGHLLSKELRGNCITKWVSPARKKTQFDDVDWKSEQDIIKRSESDRI